MGAEVCAEGLKVGVLGSVCRIGGKFQVPPVREVINSHLTTGSLAELPAELVEGEALCGGLVGNGLIGVHDSPGLLAVMALGCHPSIGGVGRQGCRAWGVALR